MAQYEDLFVAAAVTEELGFGVPEGDDGFLLTDASVMAASHVVIGSLPVIVYLVAGRNALDSETSFAFAAFVCAFGLFLLGSAKSAFNHSVSWAYSGAEALFPAAACAAIAYLLARQVAEFF